MRGIIDFSLVKTHYKLVSWTMKRLHEEYKQETHKMTMYLTMSSKEVRSDTPTFEGDSPLKASWTWCVLALPARLYVGLRRHRLHISPSGFELERMHNNIMTRVDKALLKTSGAHQHAQRVQEQMDDIADIINDIESLLAEIHDFAIMLGP